MRLTTAMTFLTITATMIINACGTADNPAVGQPRHLAQRECIGDMPGSAAGLCTVHADRWRCQRNGSEAFCRRDPLKAPDAGRPWLCEHRGVQVTCTAAAPAVGGDDGWRCDSRGDHTACTSVGALIPPASGLWRCHFDDLALECEGRELEMGDDHGGDRPGGDDLDDDEDAGVDDEDAGLDDEDAGLDDEDAGAEDDLGGMRADLPYDVRPQLGQTFRLSDAFLVKGGLPPAILGVTMEGGDWRLSELQADSPFVVDGDDCAHQGNRDIGRDRVFVTWSNADGSVETDHLDIRYCKN